MKRKVVRRFKTRVARAKNSTRGRFDGTKPGPGRPPDTPVSRIERHVLRRAEHDTYVSVMEGVGIAQRFAPEMIHRLMDLARSTDDDTALRAAEQLATLMLWPKSADDLRMRLPAIGHGTASDRSAAILTALADGSITPATAETLLALIKTATESTLTEQIVAKVAEVRSLLDRKGLGHLLPALPGLVSPGDSG